MDGVIVDSEPVHFRVEKRMFEELGIHLSDKEHAAFLGTSSQGMFGSLKERFGLEETVEAMVAEEHRRFRKEMTQEPPPLIPGVRDLARRFHLSGRPLAVASSAPHEQIDFVLHLGGMEEFFPVRVSGDDVERSKPHPAIFLEAARRLGRRPAECVVIEDSENGVTAARAAGMVCIGFSSPGSMPQDLSAADHTAASMEEVDRLLAALPKTQTEKHP